jgi:phospholipid/cholesterol/gamma-HCH transport system permease protein
MTLLGSLVNPRRFRVSPIINQMDSTGLNALPIVAVLSFFVGAVIAFLGASLLGQFGAQVFTVELIGIAMLREFGVLLTAILLAGRSASSYAAAIGAMKMNQEIDAMEVMGVDPFEALVVPRFIAMQFMFPLLAFVATASGLFGGMVVCWISLDLSPAFYLQRIVDNVGANHFWAGLVKAPVFAAVIAAVGTRQGLQVGGDVESLGARVTSAVVQAIFAIIVIDAVFAVLLTELGL